MVNIFTPLMLFILFSNYRPELPLSPTPPVMGCWVSVTAVDEAACLSTETAEVKGQTIIWAAGRLRALKSTEMI